MWALKKLILSLQPCNEINRDSLTGANKNFNTCTLGIHICMKNSKDSEEALGIYDSFLDKRERARGENGLLDCRSG